MFGFGHDPPPPFGKIQNGSSFFSLDGFPYYSQGGMAECDTGLIPTCAEVIYGLLWWALKSAHLLTANDLR